MPRGIVIAIGKRVGKSTLCLNSFERREVYVGSAAHDEPGPSDIGLPVLDIPEIMDTEDAEILSLVMEADFSCIEEDSSEDDDQPEIQQIILSSDEEEEDVEQEDFEETTAPEASTFFEGLPNLLNEIVP